jgi:hypothetical protein
MLCTIIVANLRGLSNVEQPLMDVVPASCRLIVWGDKYAGERYMQEAPHATAAPQVFAPADSAAASAAEILLGASSLMRPEKPA